MKISVAYTGTRDICARISTKILNAVDEYFRDGVTNNALRIMDDNSAEHMEFMALRMEGVANIGQIIPDSWDAVKLAMKINNELKTGR